MFTIGYGVGVNASRDENNYRSVAQVLADTSLQSELSFDPNQVDARVNGTVVDVNAAVSANMRIELVKKAGRKSSGDCQLMGSDNQLSSIGVSYEVNQVLGLKVSTAKAPFYTKLEEAEKALRKDVKIAQRKAVGESENFVKFNEAIIDQLVDTNYVDSVGSLTVPVAIREELAAIASTADASLEGLRKEVKDAEAKIAAWHTSVYADLAMTVTIAEQKAVLAKVVASEPTSAWTLVA
jgi:hypothetical protein